MEWMVRIEEHESLVTWLSFEEANSQIWKQLNLKKLNNLCLEQLIPNDALFLTYNLQFYPLALERLLKVLKAGQLHLVQ